MPWDTASSVSSAAEAGASRSTVWRGAPKCHEQKKPKPTGLYANSSQEIPKGASGACRHSVIVHGRYVQINLFWQGGRSSVSASLRRKAQSQSARRSTQLAELHNAIRPPRSQKLEVAHSQKRKRGFATSTHGRPLRHCVGRLQPATKTRRWLLISSYCPRVISFFFSSSPQRCRQSFESSLAQGWRSPQVKTGGGSHEVRRGLHSARAAAEAGRQSAPPSRRRFRRDLRVPSKLHCCQAPGQSPARPCLRGTVPPERRAIPMWPHSTCVP
mmetsp:Transcript_27663/g.65682  ORF Transcript_27663/g.65682 Transcript_27663/m.65682 type:complete len:271 (-) Transcript_27663:2106-2918(-)